jgi:peptidoglycan/xylan/chitin deacetylase (PgdA/CDA1 family)
MSADRGLRLAPAALYVAKATATRARSALWLARTRGGTAATPAVRILFYHRVAPERDELAVSPAAFAAQMELLAARGYRGVHVGDLIANLDTVDGPPLVGLSFDVGYADIAEHAAPVLEAHGFTATVFVATGVAAGRTSFPWYARQPRVLGRDEIAALDGGALRFEAHTVSHPNLLAIGDDEARREVAESKAELEDWLGRLVDGFCYPAGLYGPRDRGLVADAGFRWATTCEPGTVTAASDVLALPRIQIDARDSLLDVRAKLLGGHDTPPPFRALYRRFRYGAPARASSRS